MRTRLLGLAAILAATGWQPALAQSAPPPPPRPEAQPQPQAEAPRRPSTLDDLYARLAAAKDEDEAKGVAGLIERRLERSGSDTADLLLSRAGEALKAKDAALAVELLDRVTQLRPAWAEAWLRRAAAFWQLEDPSRALMDLEEALSREPRHFTAWMVMGHLEMTSGDKGRALAAYRRALKIHPFLEDAEKAVKRLAPEVDGRDL
jgi:Tfp pilus assembly protein PilF